MTRKEYSPEKKNEKFFSLKEQLIGLNTQQSTINLAFVANFLYIYICIQMNLLYALLILSFILPLFLSDYSKDTQPVYFPPSCKVYIL